MISIRFAALGGDASVEIPLPSCFVPDDEFLVADTIVENTHIQSGPFWDRIKNILPPDRTHTALMVGDQIIIDDRVYTFERPGWSLSRERTIVDDVDEAIHSGMYAYTAYAVWGDHELCTVFTFTNDNLDTGMPGEWAEWRYDLHLRNGMSALEQARRITGGTRWTPGGVVSVYVNGQAVIDD